MENHPSLQYRRVWVKDERQVQTPVYNETAPNSTPSHVGALRSLKPTPWHPCPAAPRALVFPRTPCLSPFGVHQEEKGEIVKGKMRARKKIIFGIWKWESIGPVSSSLSTSTLHFFLKVKEVTCQLGKASVSGSSIWLPAVLPSTYVGSCFKACWEV